MASKTKIERPLGLKLILVYDVILAILAISSGTFGLGGILLLVALYYGLWKMNKEWMYVLSFLMGISTLAMAFYAIVFQDILNMVTFVINVTSIYWLWSNRDLFIAPKKKGSVIGTKSEWIRFGLIMLGIIGIPSLSAIINMDYFGYSLLLVPVWGIFVWFFLPKLLKWK